MAHDIFISYSANDKPTADAVCATLEARGLRCWIAPRDVLPGADWSEAIIDAIAGSRALVLVFSQHANTSQQVRREVERAVHKGIAVVPMRIADVPMSKSLEYFISTPHWLDALTPPLQQHLDYLAETLKRFVVTLPPHASQPAAPAVSHDQPAAALHGIEPQAAAPVSPGPPAPGVAAPTGRPDAVRPEWKAAWLGIAAAAAVALLALAAFVFLPRDGVPGARDYRSSSGASEPRDSGASSPRDGSPGASPRSAGPVALDVVGSWIAQSTANGVPVTVESTLEADGGLQATVTLRDSGTYQSGAGRWTMVNTAGLKTAGTYRREADGSMTIAGPLGTARWRREPGAAVDPAGGLAGRWMLTAPAPDGLPATTTLSFSGNGTYQFTAQTQDVGRVEARDGVWRSVSTTTGRTNEGTYQRLERDLLVWGSLTFRRKR